MKERKQSLKKVLALFLSALIVFSMMPQMAFADTTAEADSESTCKVTVTSQADQKFLHKPLIDTEVQANLAEEYGYEDSVSGRVSALDALVKAHITQYGASFTKDNANNYLQLDKQGNVTRYFGTETADSGVMLNGQLLQSSLGTTKLEAGDRLEFFRYAAPEKQDIYIGFSGSYRMGSNIDYPWTPVTSAKKVGGKAFSLYCYGFNVAQYGALEESERLLDAESMNNMQIGIVDVNNGEVTPISDAVTEGSYASASMTFEQTSGEVYLTAYNEALDIIMPLIKVEMVADPSLKVLKLYANQSDYNERKNSLPITPELQDGRYEYSVDVLDYVKANGVYIYSSFSANPEAPTNEYLGEKLTKMVSNQWGGWSGGNVAKANNGYFNVYYSGSMGKVADYKIKANVVATLKGLELEGIVDKAFDTDEKSYHAYLDSNAVKTTIKATGYSTSYTIKANGKEITNGESSELELDCDKNGRMEVDISVSSEECKETIYHIQFEKEPATEAPTVLQQPKSADYILGEEAEALTTKASASGTVAYQWYKNTTESTDGAQAIDDATGMSYTPSVEEIGTTYYYCQFTNKKTNEKRVSNFAKVVVDPDPTPQAILTPVGNELDEEYDYVWHTGFVYNIGESARQISVEVTNQLEGAEYSYEWMRATAVPNGETGKNGSNKYTTKTITPSTAPNDATNTGVFWRCKVTCKFKGKTYRAYATTGEKSGEEDVTGVYVFVKATDASAPKISKQPVGKEDLEVSDKDTYRLSITAQKDDGGTLTYQWYVNTTNSNTGGTPIDSATTNSYSAPLNEIGEFYYYCVVTNTLQGKTASVTSDPAKLVITDPSEMATEKLKEAEITGDGTENSPYQIETAEQLAVVQELVNDGYGFEGQYLALKADITLPADWEPMGVTKNGKNDIQGGANLNPFSGKLDGENHQITVPEGGLPLLGYVKEAEVRNLKIFGEKIDGYGLVNNFEGVGLSGSAIVIDHVTLVEGTKTKKAGLLGANITTNGFAGCSAGFVATITNCTIEEGVIVGYDGNESNIGGFAGRMQGTVENCVNHGTVKGKNYVGGIVGSRDNAMGACVIKDCTFDGSVTATGEQVGGIIGGAYVNSSAPNGVRVAVTGNEASGKVTGKNYVGGIMGADYYVNQNWGSGSFKLNKFSGKVKATDGDYVGGVIGYLASLNKYDNVTGNYYASDCGAKKGIGFVKYVDTSCKTHETESGATYVDTSVEKPDISGFTKDNHNRTDDPLGADAVKLTYSDDQTEPILIDLAITGNYKTEYLVGDAFSFEGMTITATYHTGETKTIDPKLVKVENFNSSQRGSQEVTLTYDGISAVINVTVLNPEGEDITVNVRILGDTLHGESAQNVHTLTDNNLLVWMETKSVTVSNNATVWEALQKAIEGTDISMTNPTGNYISAVTKGSLTLAEMANGPNSGWMYTLNGTHPEYGVSEQYLSNNDFIVLHYTDDYTKEEGSDKWEEEEIVTSKDVAASVSGSEASANVSASDMDQLIQSAIDGNAAEITLNVTGAGQSSKVTVEIPKASLQAVADKTDASLKVDTALGQVTFDRRAMDETVKAASGSTIRIVLEKRSLSAGQKEQLGSNAAMTAVSLWSGQQEIRDLGSGKLTVGLPVSGELTGKRLAAATVDPEGKLSKISGRTVTIGGKNYYQFTLSAGGTFVLAEETLLDAAIAAQDEENPLIAGVENTTIEASSVLGDGYVKVKWTKSAGYKVDAYEIYRSTKKDSGYGDTPYFTTKQGGLSGWYKNTKELKKGTRYYYKVRGKREIDGKTYYTQWSNAAYRTYKAIGKGVRNTSVKAWSTAEKGNIRVNWKKSAGYAVDYYQVYRSTKRNSGYGEKPYFTTKQGGLSGWYKNTKNLKKGTRYYYKVRGVRELDGKKVYTQWSNLAYRVAK